jgi:UDP-N-acetylmuramoyl-L-alanyl-D-glutamate--2,6-diaminopimelate ligase
MLLSVLAAQLDAISVDGSTDRSIERVCYDSRTVRDSDLFVAIRGEQVDSRRFVPDLEVAAVIADGPVRARPGVTVIQVDNARLALARAAAAMQGHPGEDLPVIGITGTNGKTTVAWMIEAIINATGKTSGVIGTTGHRIAGAPIHAKHTTPEAPVLQKLLRRMVDEGCAAALMEVSSIGIVMHRTDAIPFRVGVFTSFSRDHLDFHTDMEDYLDAKARLFHTLLAPNGIAILNSDEAACEGMDTGGRETWTYGMGQKAAFRAVDLRTTVDGTHFTMLTPQGGHSVLLVLKGNHNVMNALAAVAAATALGISTEHCIAGIEGLTTIPGRLESVENDKNITVLVDYAHTPDALRTVLKSLRPLTRGRILTVFGCGGSRDSGKRPEMGTIAVEGSDWVFVTSDNPRHENPMDIIGDIVGGIDGPHNVEPNRKKAITAAINSAKPGDIVLIAGKGHETTQITGDKVTPFDDRLVAAQALRELP